MLNECLSGCWQKNLRNFVALCLFLHKCQKAKNDSDVGKKKQEYSEHKLEKQELRRKSSENRKPK